jgi:AcrR family transcriptional regulator
MTQSRRERLRADARIEIMALARQQIAAEGAAALSLRAIARDMGMTAPALYRYFASRDDLLTALILESYNALADALEQSVQACPPQDYRARFRAFAKAYRDWAVAHPRDYMFIFTTSVPGYHAPDEITVPAAARSMGVFSDIVAEAQRAGKLHLSPDDEPRSPALKRALADAEQRYGYPPGTLYVGLIGWARLHGLICLEIFNHTGPIIGDPGLLYTSEVDALETRLGLSD